MSKNNRPSIKFLLPLAVAGALLFGASCSSKTSTPAAAKKTTFADTSETSLEAGNKTKTDTSTTSVTLNFAKGTWKEILKAYQNLYTENGFNSTVLKKSAPGNVEDMAPMSEATCANEKRAEYGVAFSNFRKQLNDRASELKKSDSRLTADEIEEKVKVEFQKRLKTINDNTAALLEHLKSGEISGLSKTLQTCEIERMQNFSTFLDEKIIQSEIDQWKAKTEEVKTSPESSDDPKPKRMNQFFRDESGSIS